MKKLILILLALCTILTGCKVKAHWSHEACVEEIVKEYGFEDYEVEVWQIDKESMSDDTIYSFDIIITENGIEYRFYCFAVIDDDEIMYVDCDLRE